MNALLQALPPVGLGLIGAGLGLVVGSFIALVSVRLPASEPLVVTRSRCRACGTPLGALELVPLISWLVQRGRCRRCGTPISPRYPLIEAGSAALGAWALMADPGWVGISGAIFAWWLLAASIIDAEHYWLPDGLTLPLAALGLIFAAWLEPTRLAERAIGAAVGFGILALLGLLYRRVRGREGLGGGDPRLLAAIGAWVGWIALPTVLVWAALAGLSLTLARRLRGRRVALSDALPFGPMLAVGGWLAWLYGPLGRAGL